MTHDNTQVSRRRCLSKSLTPLVAGLTEVEGSTATGVVI